MPYYEVRIKPERNRGFIAKLKGYLAPKRFAFEHATVKGLFFVPQNPFEKRAGANFFLAGGNDDTDEIKRKPHEPNKPEANPEKPELKTPGTEPPNEENPAPTKPQAVISNDITEQQMEQLRLMAEQRYRDSLTAGESDHPSVKDISLKTQAEDKKYSLRELIEKGEFFKLINLVRLGRLDLGKASPALIAKALILGIMKSPAIILSNLSLFKSAGSDAMLEAAKVLSTEHPDAFIDNYDKFGIKDTDALERITLGVLRKKPGRLGPAINAFMETMHVDKDALYRMQSFSEDIFSIFDKDKGLIFRSPFTYARTALKLIKVIKLFRKIAAVSGEAASTYIGSSKIYLRSERVKIAMISASQNGPATAKLFENYQLGLEPEPKDAKQAKKLKAKQMKELKGIFLAAYTQNQAARNYADNIYPLIDKEKDVAIQMKKIDARLKRDKKKK